MRVEPWIISARLDGTIRKWRLSELLKPAPIDPTITQGPQSVEHILSKPESQNFELTADEERELAELLDSE